MSPVISNDPTWNEEWHEELLTISSLLEKGPLQREELKKRIRSIQKAKSAFFEPHLPNKYHKYRNYDYWIRKLIERELIEEANRVLMLTSLGEWITKSKLGSLFERDSFLESFVCKKCSSLPNIVLLTPLLDTIDVNSINVKGQIWVNLRCPKCGTVDTHGLSFSKDKLVKFYNQAVVELKQFGNLEAQGI
ncbi:MAG: hypothetical protein KAX20_06355 [Candidatus Omnitrophica bacterium]|nr:hypothetical protein [Candidatus Omnitrophota bacterium]